MKEGDSLGSSPRMRGSHTEKEVEEITGGIIPAHAGLTGRPARCQTG